VAGRNLGGERGRSRRGRALDGAQGGFDARRKPDRQGRPHGFEFLRIEADPSGLVYLASPQGRPATPFPLKELSGQRVVFENPEHDFPQRVLYWRDAEDSLHARIEGTRGGRTAAQEWVWRRVREGSRPRESRPPGVV
jgi:hypothetical protein